MKLTLSQAMKKIKELESRKDYLIKKEYANFTYSYTDGEEPIIPDYDYQECTRQIRKIDSQVRKLRMAINKVNNESKVSFEELTIAEGLIKLGQISNAIRRLENLLLYKDFTRTLTKSGVVEYSKSMVSMETVRANYEALTQELAALQISIDNANSTYTIDVNL